MQNNSFAAIATPATQAPPLRRLLLGGVSMLAVGLSLLEMSSTAQATAPSVSCGPVTQSAFSGASYSMPANSSLIVNSGGGYQQGVDVAGAACTISNSGTLGGVNLSAIGRSLTLLDNLGSGTISALTAVRNVGSIGLLSNSGSIGGSEGGIYNSGTIGTIYNKVGGGDDIPLLDCHHQ